MRFNRIAKYCLFFLALTPSSALASLNLKQVQVNGQARVDLLFDGKISKSQIKTEFIGNSNLLDAVVVGIDADAALIRTERGLTLRSPGRFRAAATAPRIRGIGGARRRGPPPNRPQANREEEFSA